VEANRLPGWKNKLLPLSGLVGRVLPSLLHQTPEVDARSQIPHFDLAIFALGSCRCPLAMADSFVPINFILICILYLVSCVQTRNLHPHKLYGNYTEAVPCVRQFFFIVPSTCKVKVFQQTN